MKFEKTRQPDPAFLADLRRQVSQDQAREDAIVAVFTGMAAITELRALRPILTALAWQYLDRTRATGDYHDRLYELEDIRGILASALRKAETALEAHKEKGNGNLTEDVVPGA